ALDVEHVLFLAEEVPLAQLDRGVAAAVQDERAVAAEQARGVDPRTERTGELRRVGVAPEALHGAIILFTTDEHRAADRAPAVGRSARARRADPLRRVRRGAGRAARDRARRDGCVIPPRRCL